MTVNIEHVGINQDVEHAVEYVLTLARDDGYSNFAKANVGDKEYLPEANVIHFLDAIMGIAEKLLAKMKSPSQRQFLRMAYHKILLLRKAQEEYFGKNEKYIQFPASQQGVLSNHLKGGFKI